MTIKYFVYIALCADGTLYTGKTTDLDKRVREHNGEIKNGAKYTRGRRPVKMVFVEEHLSNSSAARREAQIKQLKRTGKLELINTHDLHKPLKQ